MDPRVMVIDDDLMFQKLIRQRIEARWPKATVVISDPTRGAALSADFDGNKYDVVLLDYRLGSIDGLALLGAFRKKKNFPPVIMISGAGDERLAVAAVRAGAADYLSKQGLTQVTLISSMEEALAARPPRVDDAPAPATEAPLPRMLGYAMLRAVGAGKAGRVYLARREKDGVELVLKLVNVNLSPTDNEELIQRCLREFSVMELLNTPRVARIHEQRFTDDGLFIAMEYLPRGSLRDALQAGALPVPRALALVRSLAEALRDIHAAGILHRDLKPGNIMLREDGSVALIDFGIAREIERASTLTRVGAMLGTPHYVSPEQGQGQAVDARSDLYSLGVILYELLVHDVPYRARTLTAVLQKHIHAPLPQLPVQLWLYQALIDRLMAKSPDDRYPNATAVMEAIDGLLAPGA